MRSTTRTVILSLALLAVAAPARAQVPTGHTTDCATVTPTSDGLSITQLTPDCVIDWESFSIDEGWMVSFIQDDSWRVLNRVTGAEFTQIAGTLTGNGAIYIVNPAGIFFGATAVVNAAQIYAIAAALSNDDFTSGTDLFTTPTGHVVNDGTLLAPVVHLAGLQVANNGYIIAPGGVVTMTAASDSIYLREEDERILVQIDGTDLTTDFVAGPGGSPVVTGDAGVTNTGIIEAAAGQVVLGVGDLYSLAVKNSGRINAPGGSAQLAAISGTVLHGGPDAEIVAGEVAMSGGSIVLESDVNASQALFNDAVFIGDTVTIEGESAGTAASAVAFASTVNSMAGESNALTVRSAETTFGGDVGTQSALSHLDVEGDATIAGSIITTDGIDLSGAATLTGANQILGAGSGGLHAGSIDKTTTGSLTLLAGGGVLIDGSLVNDGGSILAQSPSLSVGGDLGAAGNITSLAATDVGGDITAGATLQISGPATVGGDVSAGGNAVFVGDADIDGSLTAGANVQVNGTTTIGGNVAAAGNTIFVGAADIGGDVTAGGGAQFFQQADVIGNVIADEVTFSGAASVGGSVSAAGDATFLSTAQVGGSVIAGDGVRFDAAADIMGNVTAGNSVEFFGTAIVGGNVSAVDDVVFAGSANVGGNVAADDNVEFLGSAVVGGSVSAGNDATFASAAQIGGDVTAADSVLFSGSSTVGGDVTAGDDADFIGSANVGGSVTAADNVTFHATATVGGDVTAGMDADLEGDDVNFLGDAVVGGSVSAADRVKFFGTATVGGNVSGGDDVEFDGDATVGGNVSAGDDVRFFSNGTVGGTVNAGDDIKFFHAANVGGDLIAGDDIEILGDALLGGDVIAFEDVILQGNVTLNGLGAQLVRGTIGALTVNGTLVKTTDGDLVLVSNEAMSFGGPLVQALGNILLNPDGHAGVPVTATIGSDGDLVIISLGGSIVMGQNEKLTVPGTLTMSAAQSITLGDVTTAGDMHVTAQQILLRTRMPGEVLGLNGQLFTDNGLDLAAGGRFFFSVTPTLLGNGLVFFGSPALDPDALDTLQGVRFRVLLPFGAADLQLDDGTVLDMRVDGPVVSELAEALDGERPPATRTDEDEQPRPSIAVPTGPTLTAPRPPLSTYDTPR